MQGTLVTASWPNTPMKALELKAFGQLDLPLVPMVSSITKAGQCAAL